MLMTVARTGVAICAWTSLGGCGTADATSPVPDTRDGAVRVTPDEIRLTLAGIPALATVGGAYVVSAANVIVLRLAERDYRAFSNVCTHSGCGISIFRESRMLCQCHGSEFDTEGRNVAGPAPTPLASFRVTLDQAQGVLVVARGASSSA